MILGAEFIEKKNQRPFSRGKKSKATPWGKKKKKKFQRAFSSKKFKGLPWEKIKSPFSNVSFAPHARQVMVDP